MKEKNSLKLTACLTRPNDNKSRSLFSDHAGVAGLKNYIRYVLIYKPLLSEDAGIAELSATYELYYMCTHIHTSFFPKLRDLPVPMN